jgi:hypothetical protein
MPSTLGVLLYRWREDRYKETCQKYRKKSRRKDGMQEIKGYNKHIKISKSPLASEVEKK